ncbi:type II secretion system F family protein [Corynebacterium sp. LK2510]|uniref:type II secretion system F family protein n=1 Tax=Corynebacterium sp. LK2510 TaxID=3110472 RepID=UPI0034CFE120
MSLALSLVMLAAACAVPAAGAAGRVAETKEPRAGPGRRTGHRPDRLRTAGDIELLAACLRAGLPAAHAASAVAESYAEEEGTTAEVWRTVAALSALGAEPQRAWSDLRDLPGGADVADLIALSGASGAAAAAGCERIAARLRDDAADDATAKAERAGVLIAIPLTAFFLPAFFVLGLAPVVVGLAGRLT